MRDKNTFLYLPLTSIAKITRTFLMITGYYWETLDGVTRIYRNDDKLLMKLYPIKEGSNFREIELTHNGIREYIFVTIC